MANEEADEGREPPQWMIKDLAWRFLLSATEEEQEATHRMLFLAERAHWFYEDHCRVSDPSLKRKSLKQFAKLLFACDGLTQHLHGFSSAYDRFMQYKKQVPSCGAVILHSDMSHVLMVSHANSNVWSFPRGKRARYESFPECAAREVLEETGCDISGHISEDSQCFTAEIGGRTVRLYAVSGVDMPTHELGARTMNEIGSVAWQPVGKIRALAKGKKAELDGGGKLINVAPFAPAICKWVQRVKKQSRSNKRAQQQAGSSAADAEVSDTAYAVQGGDSSESLNRGKSQLQSTNEEDDDGADGEGESSMPKEGTSNTTDECDDRDMDDANPDAMLQHGLQQSDQFRSALLQMCKRAKRSLEPLLLFQLDTERVLQAVA